MSSDKLPRRRKSVLQGFLKSGFDAYDLDLDQASQTISGMTQPDPAKVSPIKKFRTDVGTGAPTGARIDSRTVAPSDTPRDISKAIPVDTPTDISRDLAADTSIAIPADNSTGIPADIPTGRDPTTGLQTLNENQFILYSILKSLQGELTNLPLISKEVGISANTLKANMKRLINLMLIKEKSNIRTGTGGVGTSVIVEECNPLLIGDRDRVDRILKAVNLEHVVLKQNCNMNPSLYRRVHPEVYPQVYPRVNLQGNPQVRPRLNPQIDPPFSSSSPNGNTTTVSGLSPKDVFSSDPKSLYWQDKGLTAKQVERWMDEADMSLDDMMQSLEYCWYEMVHLNLEEKKNIRDVLSWFYQIIRRNGCYPCPKDFKSFDEIRAEEMEKGRRKKEEALKKLKEEVRKEYELEKESRFWQMMSNPESDEYQKCLGTLNNFEKGLKGGPTFENAMRRAFERDILGETSEKTH